MTDLEIYEELIRLTRAGTPFALTTVIASSGSSPRKPGAKMLVRDDGSTLGTVGGGRVEAETVQAALAAMTTGVPLTLPFELTEEHGFVCGGALRVYIEPHGNSRRLVMFGGGHVGKAVTELAAGCGFHVTVVDERPEMANRQAIPAAADIICATADNAFATLTVTEKTAIVIATTGHDLDFQAVRGALRTRAGFVGLLGSKRKREVLLQTLEREGFSTEDRARVVTPVGLAIGAETPAEIAVSIVAQLVQERRSHAAASVGHTPGRRDVAADGMLQAATPP